MHIALDLDNTLAATEAVFRRLIADETGRRFGPEAIVDYDVQRACGLADEEMARVVARFLDPAVWDGIPLLLGAAAFSQVLARRHRVTVLTGRSPDLEPVTRGWLERHAIAFHDLCFLDKETAHDPTAVEAFDAFVDDHPRFSLALAEEGRRVYLADRPWNRELHHPNLVRFRAFAEVLQTLCPGG